MAPSTPKPWRETPLIESANLSKAASWYLNCRSRIFLKLETLQPSGSFKSRGLGLYCQRALSRSKNPDAVHFYSSSGGNAGLACVHAAKTLGRPSTVVVPMSTKAFMIAKIQAAGANEVVQFGASWREADGYMKEVVMRKAEGKGEEAVYVSPFDDPEIWEGHETLVKEVGKQLSELGEEDGEPDVMICSAGGGGLAIGHMQGIAKQGWQKTQLVVMNTVGADALAKSLQEKEMVTLPGITSLATSLGATRVSERAFELASKGLETGRVKSCVLTDAEAAMGSWRFADDERILVELACGVNVALCYGGRLSKALGRPVRKEEKVVIAVCGGSNVSTEMVEGWRRQFGDLDSDVTSGHGQIADVPSAVTAPNAV